MLNISCTSCFYAFMFLLLCMDLGFAQELVENYNPPMKNVDYPTSNFVLVGTSVLTKVVANASMCGMWCSKMYPGETLTPCVAFVYSNQSYKFEVSSTTNQTYPAGSCIPKHSTTPSIDRDGSYHIYSYVKSSGNSIKYGLRSSLCLAVAIVLSGISTF